MHSRRWLTGVLCAAWMSVGGGCATGAFDRTFSFTPGLVERSVELEGARPRQSVRTLVAIAGVRFARDAEPAAVEVRFRIENATHVEATIDPASLRLTPADFGTLGAAVIVEGETTAAPRTQETFVTRFPFPAGSSRSDYDLSGVSVSWSLRVGDDVRPQSATFTRRAVVYPTRPTYWRSFGHRHGRLGHRGYCW